MILLSLLRSWDFGFGFFNFTGAIEILVVMSGSVEVGSDDFELAGNCRRHRPHTQAPLEHWRIDGDSSTHSNLKHHITLLSDFAGI